MAVKQRSVGFSSGLKGGFVIGVGLFWCSCRYG